MKGSTIETTRHITLAERKQALLAYLNENPFVPAWWLRNRHAQTIWGPRIARTPRIPYERQVWDTPDGDELSVYTYRGEPEKPWVLLLHGLEGCIRSYYIPRLNRDFHRLGWNVATMIFRSCDGTINKGRRIYHMGETSDLDFVVSELPGRFGAERVYIAGMSLGANVLCKWLGEDGDGVPALVQGAAALSPPFRPEEAIAQFNTSLFGIYNRFFLKTLIKKALEKERQFPGCIDVEKVRNCTSFHVYDTEVTARLHGFTDAQDYWTKVGCHQFLEAIRVPTMLLTAEDDAFNPGHTIPRDIADASDYLIPQWTEKGGHGGFVGGRWPWAVRYWMDEQVLRFFAALEKETVPYRS